MANVGAEQSRLAPELVAYLEDEWERIPAIIDTWPRLGSQERAAIALDWPANEVTLDRLQRIVDSGTAGQDVVVRFRALAERIAAFRPAIEALFAEDGTVRASA
ncbi:hypothetical protein EDM76_01225 [bacterium]|nr:MAG: hypothetical protein EDM76_01225 [bacterium]MCL4232660.1 hypothetical protein [Dehalococcoidia bacterium]